MQMSEISVEKEFSTTNTTSTNNATTSTSMEATLTTEATTARIEKSIVDMFALDTLSNVGGENVGGIVDANVVDANVPNVVNSSKNRTPHADHSTPITWTTMKSQDFTVSVPFKSLSTFKGRPDWHEQFMPDAEPETRSLLGQLELGNEEQGISLQPQMGNRSNSGPSQQIPCLEPKNNRTISPHLTRSGLGSRAKSCPDPRNKRLGGSVGDGDREESTKTCTNASSYTPPPHSVP
jgi:hypothetical protein